MVVLKVIAVVWCVCGVLALIYGMIFERGTRRDIIDAVITIVTLGVCIVLWPLQLYSVSKNIKQARRRQRENMTP